VIGRLLTRLYTRRCRGCDDQSFHTHHLTRLGRAKYAGERLPLPTVGFVLAVACLAIAGLDLWGAAVQGRTDLVPVVIVLVAIALINLWLDRVDRKRRAER
jgi:hypothetical protein